MPLYKFTAKDTSGKNVIGELDTLDEKSVVKTLQKENLIPIEVKLSTGKAVFKEPIKFAGGSVSSSEIVGFTRQLSTMISAGLPLINALTILQKQTKSPNFSKILSQIMADIEGGMSLSVSLSKHPKVFGVIFVKLIEAGETGGVLDKVLNKLAQSLEKEREFKAKTRGAFIYPAIVIFVMTGVIMLMMIFVIPQLAGLYEELGIDLPLPTRVLIATSNFVRGFWWLLILLGFGGLYAFHTYAKTEGGTKVVSTLVLRLPVWGKIRRTLVLTEFTRTLGLLVGTGIPIITALKIVSEILSSSIYKEGVEQAIDRVQRGAPLYQPLAANPAFPPIIGQMMRVGEETGKMDEVLGRLSLYFEAESEHLITGLTTALEPIILVILGAGVGLLVLSIVLPIYNLTGQF